MRARSVTPMRVVGVRRVARRDLLRSTALCGAAILVLAAPSARAQPAPNARPIGGQVVGGQAAIGRTATTTTITQGTPRAAIDWRGFDVGSQQTVDFNQPSTSAITLNRVTSPNPSQIAGKIEANGQVVIVNQSGVLFSKGSQVETAGLVVSASGISTKNFMAGNLAFDQAPHPGARIQNDGTITVRDAGLAALVAPNVVNTGVIQARMGHVVLAGAAAHTVDLYGDGMLSINVTKQVTTVPTGPDGKPVTALVTNTGLVRADGGTVTLTARAVDGLVQNLVSAGGTLAADTIGTHTGMVLVSGVGGSVTVSGRVSATGRGAGEHGGAIALNATDTVTLAGTARVNASGAEGGGTVAVGTTLARSQGGPTVTGEPTARRTVVAAGARIRADARVAGDGGRVTVLSTDATTMAGAIAARGGATSGNGGQVEISGGTVALTGSANVLAPHGTAGIILLDPTDLAIVASGGDVVPNPAAPNVAAADAGTQIDTTQIAALSGNVQLQATNNVTVATALDLTALTGITRLELDAGNAILVNAAITSPNGDLSLNAGAGGITLGANVSATGHTVSLVGDSLTGAGTVTAATVEIAPASAIPITLGGTTAGTLSLATLANVTATQTLRLGAYTTGGGVLTPTATGIAIAGATDLTAVAPTVDLRTTATGAITQSAGLTVGMLTGNAGSVTLTNTANAVTKLGAFTTAGSFALTNGEALMVTGPLATGTAAGTTLTLTTTVGDLVTGSTITAPTVALTAAGNLTIGGAISAATGATLVAQNGDITETAAGTLATASLTGSAAIGTSANAGKAMLDNAGNTVTAVAGFTTSGSFTLVNAGALAGTGTITTGTAAGTAITLTTTAGDLTVDTLTAPTVSLTGAGSVIVTGTVSTRVANETGITATAQNGDVRETGAGLLDTASLTASATAGTGLLTLTGANTVSVIASLSAAGDIALANGSALATGSITSTGGNVALTQAAGQSLTLNSGATLTAGTGKTLSLVADALVNNGGTLAAPTGTVEIAPNTASAVTLGTSGTGLAIDPALLTHVTAAMLRIGGALGATTPSATSITVNAAVAPGAATLELDAVNAVSQTAAGAITAGTLTATAGSVALDTAVNQVGALGPVTTTGNIAFKNGQTLTVAGALTTGTAPGTTLALTTTAGDIVVGAGITAPSVSLISAGTITETATGFVSTAALSGSATGAATFDTTAPGGNQVAGLAGFTAGGNLVVVDSAPLTVTGTATSTAGNLLLRQTTAGQSLTLGAGSVVQVGAGGRLSLVADAITFGGSLAAPSGTIEVAPTSGIGVTLGGTAANTLSLPTVGALAGGATLRIGGYTDPTTATILPTATTIGLVGPINVGLATGATTLDLRGSGGVSQSGALTVGTLTGATGSAALNSGNAVTTLGPFTTAGDLSLTNGQSLTVKGTVQSTGGNLTLREDAGMTLTLAPASVVSVGGTNRLTLVADAIVLNGSVSAPSGTVEIAPASALAIIVGVSLPGPLTLASLANVSAGTLRLGGYTSAPTVITTTATDIDFAPTDLTKIAATLDLRGSGLVSEGGPLTVATLTGASGSVAFNTVSNGIASIGPFTTAGDFALTDGRTLTVTGPLAAGTPTSSGAVTLATTAGGLTVAGDITARAPGRTGVTLTTNGATDDVLQTGGTIATDGAIAVNAGRNVSLDGGVMTAGQGVTISATGGVTQGTHTLSAGGNISLVTGAAGFTQSAGGFIGSTGGSVIIPGVVAQAAGGVLAATASVQLATASGSVPTIDGTVAGGAVSIGNAGSDTEIGGLVGGMPTFSAASGLPWPGAVTLAGNGAGAGGATTITGDYLYLPGTLAAGTSVRLVATHDIFQHARATATPTGVIATGTLSGAAGTATTLGSALLTGTNTVTSLGAFAATHSFALTDTGPLAVTGAVTAGTASAATAGDTRPSGPGTLADEVAAQPANAASAVSRVDLVAPSIDVTGTGSVAVTSVFVGGTVTPGLVALRTDALTIAAAGGVRAIDGTVAIAPLTATTVTLDGTGSAAAPGTLLLSAGTLGNIQTVDTFVPDVAGTQTLVIGRIDGSAAPLPTTIGLATGANAINLRGSAATLELDTAGDVTETGAGAGAFSVGAVTGTVGGSVRLTSGANTIDRLGTATQRTVFGITIGAAPGSTANATGLTADGDVAVTGNGAMTVVGSVSAGTGRTIALTAPSLAVDHTSIAVNGLSANAGSLSVGAVFGAPVGGVTPITPGLIALRTDTLSIMGGNGLVSAPDGTVAIAPLTVGRAVTLDGSGIGLSLSPTTLAGISTIGVSTGPVGAATLALGSLDGGTTRLAGSIATGTADTTGIATTVGLFATGDITGGLTASVLTGDAGVTPAEGNAGSLGSIRLVDASIGQIGASNVAGAYSTSTTAETNLTATGDILVQSRTATLTLAAGTTVLAGNDPLGALRPGVVATAEIDGHAVTIDGTLQAGGQGTAGLAVVRAGVDVATGNAATGPLVVSASGAVLGTGTVGGATLVSGYNLAGTSVSYSGAGRDGNRVEIDGLVGGTGGGAAGLVTLRAGGRILAPGTLRAGTLTGRAGFSADLRGTNTIANLGPFDANLAGTADTVIGAFGLAVGDQAPLTVTGPLTDNLSATTGGIQVVTAGTTLIVAAPVTAGTVDLEAPGAAITETVAGNVVATTLTADAASVDLSTAANHAVAVSGAASNGGFALQNGQTLTVGGPGVTAMGAVALTAQGGDLTIASAVTAGTTATLQAFGTTAGTGAIAINAVVSAPSSVTLKADQGITETGSIATALLTGRAGIAPVGAAVGTLGSATLTGANHVMQLGDFATTGAFALSDAQALAVGGTVQAGLALPATPGVGGATFGISLTATGNMLTINGAVTAGSGGAGGDIFLGAGTIAVPGSVTASAGANGGGTVTLASTGDATATGAIAAATLAGTVGGAAALTGANTIQNLAGFTAGNTLTLQDGRDLAITGAVASTNGDVSLFAHAGGGTAGNLTQGGSVTAANGTITLTADAAIAVNATLSAPTVTLNAGTDITEAGSVATALLTGHAGAPGVLGSATLNTGTNQIVALGDFSTTGALTLADSGPLTVSGTVQTGLATPSTPGVGTGTFGATLSAPGNLLTVSGALSAGGPGAVGGDVSLAAGTIAIPGAITATAGPNGGGTVRVTATGDITETGSITAVALGGSAGGTASFTGTNAIQGIAGFVTNGPLSFVFDRDLAITGLISSTGASVSLTAHAGGGTPGNLVIDADVTAATSVTLVADASIIQSAGAITANTTASLTAGGAIAIGGTVNAPTVTLAAGNSVTETGSITTGLLTGAVTGSTLLGSATNQITALGDFATTGAFALTDAQTLTLGGTVTSGPGGATITVPGNTLTIAGTLASVGGDVALSAGTILIPGAVSGGTVSLVSAGAITETGALTAAALTGSAQGTASFTGTNQIGTLAGFFAGGSLTLADNQTLTVDGAVTAHGGVALAADTAPGTGLVIAAAIDGPTIDLRATGAIIEAPGGALLATLLTGLAGGADLSQTGNQIVVLGGFTTVGSFALQDGRSLAVNGAAMSTDGSIAIAAHAGAGTAGTLAVNAPVTATTGGVILSGDAGLTQAATAPISAGTTASLSSGGALAIGAPLSAPIVLLAANGDIAQTGAIAAGLLTGRAGGSATLTDAGNQIATLGDFGTGGLFALTNTQALTIAGAISTGGATIAVPTDTLTITGAVLASGGNVTLNAAAIAIPGTVTATAGPVGGGVVQTNSAGDTIATGAVQAAALTGGAGGNALFTGANAIGSLPGFTASGAFSLNDTLSLSVTGDVSGGGPVALSSAASITQSAGTIASSAAGTPGAPSVRVDGAGGVLQQAGALLRATDPAGVLRIDASAGDITLQGFLGGPTIIVSAPNGTVTLGSVGGRNQITTGTTAGARPLPTAVISQSTFPTAQNSRGLFVDGRTVTQLGTTTINFGRQNFTGVIDATARFTLDTPAGTPAGSVTFNDLEAPTTAVYVVIGAGTSSGTINFGALTVDNSVPAVVGQPGGGATGSATYSGTVGGVGGTSAARGSQLSPQPNARYTINNCALQSVNCILLSPLIVPVTNPASDLEVGTGRRRRDDEDIVLPNVAEQDY